LTWVAVGVAGASLVGGLLSSGASSKASEEQVQAEQQALQQQKMMFQTEQGNEQPYMQLGQGAAGQLNYLLGEGTPGSYSPSTGQTASDSGGAGGFGSLNQQFNADTFKSLSPAYQFQLQQGAQGTLNNDASGQGALSGSALKDLQSYNQNFANTSFNNAFNQYQTQQNNVFSRLSNLATLGSSAGSNSTTGAGQFGGEIGSTLGSIGASQAAGTVGSANALSGAIQGGANAFYGQNALNQILNGGSTVKYNGVDPAMFGGGSNTGSAMIPTPSSATGSWLGGGDG
jgi:hypothetical protein